MCCLTRLLVFCAALPAANAQIVGGGWDTKTISQLTKNHLYIEGRMMELKPSEFKPNHIRLEMLAELISSDNVPPDLLSALKLAIKNADITTPAKGEILIVQKDLSRKERAIFETDLEVSNFYGKASDLLHNLKLPGSSIELDQNFVLPGPVPDSSEIDCKLTAFSFKGSLRGLLKELAKKRAPYGGYSLEIRKDWSLIVKLIP